MPKLTVRATKHEAGTLTSYDVQDEDGQVVYVNVIGSTISLYLDPLGASRAMRLDLSRDEAYALALVCSAIVHDDRSREGLTEAQRAAATELADDLGLLRLHGEVMAS